MKKSFLLILILGFLIPIVSSAMPPFSYFCEYQNYSVIQIEELNDSRGTYGEVICLFDDGNVCPIRSFFNGTCGQDYRREFRCIEVGEPYFSFSECCAGSEPWIKPGYIGQPHCRDSKNISTQERREMWWYQNRGQVFVGLISLGFLLFILFLFFLPKILKKIRKSRLK